MKRGLALLLPLALAACQDAPQPLTPADQFDAARASQAQNRLERATRAAAAVAGLVFVDDDERIGKIVIGVENANAAHGVRTAMAAVGFAAGTYEVIEHAPIHFAHLRNTVYRPTIAGTQIHFGQYVCTMGFNVDHSGGRSFITNSHCTNTQGGTEGTQYSQPSRSIDPTVIATEAADPQYFKNGACPKGKKCRYSDSARALYSSTIASERGLTAKPSGPNNGSLEVGTDRFTTTSQDNTTTSFPIGLTVNKVGRTTGWTQGNVTRTCVNTSVSGSQIMQLCQTFVSNPGGATVVSGGDSGSGVFTITSGDNVKLVGLLWGGSSDNKTFIFSPLKYVQDELGTFNAVR